jgi:hypothetical protein
MEDKMSEGLCWKCKEKLLKMRHEATGVSFLQLDVIEMFEKMSCIHEPKGKPKCWCEYSHNFEQEKVLLKWLPGEDKCFTISFCPVCGKKL